MPRILAILALSLLSLNSYAQSPVNGKISGTVKDSVTKAAVDFATVTLFKSGSQTPVTGMSTDPKGQFSLSNIPAGTYRLAVDFIGIRERSSNQLSSAAQSA
jgi:ferric enterobactin receptor